MKFKSLRITVLSVLLISSVCLVLIDKTESARMTEEKQSSDLSGKEILIESADWDYTKHTIPVDEIRHGGPPKDGIPALTSPEYVSAEQAKFMREQEQVLGVVLNGVARAYPTRILSRHELVNERFGDLPVLVSW